MICDVMRDVELDPETRHRYPMNSQEASVSVSPSPVRWC